MEAVNINVRVDASVKKEAETLFNDLGLTMSAAITVFLKKAIAYDGLPFAVRKENLNSTTRAALAEYEDMRRHPEAYTRYSSVDAAFDEVLSHA